ncbi:hypothetical protein [Methyloversatilis thermotolerans]|uniref:hypothetical protein n=1 Tax=Methyloversatilis thermotolerans TaxID=1346290 RepID=UPI00036ECCCB|nr:hypothetical protein [Methyloversatilis thermotolerans]
MEQILHTTAAAKLLDALEDNLLLAPIQSSVVPLPHQLYALNRVVIGNHAHMIAVHDAAGDLGRGGDLQRGSLFVIAPDVVERVDTMGGQPVVGIVIALVGDQVAATEHDDAQVSVVVD